MNPEYDVFVVGGGINGVGIARDAAGRGLRTGLCEMDDLAGHTSSASTKLIHGGLRYLEHGAFGLVRKSLKERERLLRIAPHIIWPLEFVLPHHPGLRPAWVLRLGLGIYDLLGGRSSLPRSRRRRFADTVHARVLGPKFRVGFSYSDCWVEDARLVALNAVDARERGADIRVRTRLVKAERGSNTWRLTLRRADGDREIVRARALVNAAGPWVGEVQRMIRPCDRRSGVRLVRGSHLVTRRLYDGDHAYLFQTDDGRVLFTIPYEGRFTLVGTTEVAVDSPWTNKDMNAEADDRRAEHDYLLSAVSSCLTRPVSHDDVVWHYAGIRPLFENRSDSLSRVTRDYVLELDRDGAPALSVYGGKITTFRKLAEAALRQLSPVLPESGPRWTHAAPLPGGDFDFREFESRLGEQITRYSFLEPSTVRRLFRAYGTRMDRMLACAASRDDLGRHFGHGLYEIELRYLIDVEFARTAEDVLWRRSKLGLHLDPAGRDEIGRWFSHQSIKTASA